ncbi:methyltransferase domain-containing protein [Leucobacter aridicollis]|uniref:methyltransferase domain-containing protein n=1 Tax=Leucobacter aridicollis TaxID=283878 RepID=UPI002166CF8C|nr:methyltransferase domain-containing protein [Leucobacter aridicollis]MCS3427938.1 23S rRNA (uracil747-C5)-methyltransferase [Leucobacter aridicollis]
MQDLAAPPHCRYFEAGVCRSCTFIETPIDAQLRAKQERCAELLPGIPAAAWLAPVSGGVAGFRNRAKLAVGGVAGAVTLGILDRGGAGIDLTECLIHEAEIQAVIPALAGFVNASGIAPYSVPRRRGELKYVHVTVSPAGELMVRFVVRSEQGLELIRARVDELRELLPRAAVISVNLLPEHKAVLEGDREEPLVGSALAMELGEGLAPVTLYLRPQSFFQTNTRVALALYEQAATWVDGVGPASLWDLYCGVGGFALFTARSGAGAQRDVLGVELSEQAIRSAERSAAEAGIPARFLAGDATEFALAAGPDDLPEFVVVNPPRRGIGETLADWLEGSGIPHVIYSSCNPESLARDLERMPSFVVREARLFDMFPHTGHLEVAVLLERRP